MATCDRCGSSDVTRTNTAEWAAKWALGGAATFGAAMIGHIVGGATGSACAHEGTWKMVKENMQGIAKYHCNKCGRNFSG